MAGVAPFVKKEELPPPPLPLPPPPLPPPHNSPNFDAPYYDGDGRPCAKCRNCGIIIMTDVEGSLRKHSAKHKKLEWRAARRDPNANTASCREVVALKAEVADLKRKRENVKVAMENMRKTMEKVKKDLEKVKTGRDQLKEKNRCPVCVNKPCTTAFMCGHRSCDSCARRLLYCHMCRGDVTTKIRIV